jgi:transposase-like protein
MAEGHSMTAAERAAKTLLDEHADVLRDAVAMVVAQLMEAEVSAEIGAARGEVSDTRLTHRNGYRPRLWETRVGELELLIPRKRSGEAYFPSFLEPRRRSEQAKLVSQICRLLFSPMTATIYGFGGDQLLPHSEYTVSISSKLCGSQV